MEHRQCPLEALEVNMKQVSNTFWKNKKVLITGHTGFKGTWLTYWLSLLGAEVMGYAPPTENNSMFNFLELQEQCRHVEGDIRNISPLHKCVKEFNPEFIFHMAAQPIVTESYRVPLTTYEVNVMGTLNILEVARSIKNLRAFINVTTDKVYENREWPWNYRETDSLGGSDPYSSSKACSEILTHSYRRSFFEGKESTANIFTCRSGNVFGGGDWAKDRIVPDAVRAFSSNQALQIRNPESTRPWQHVLEPLRAYLLVAQLGSVEKNNLSRALNNGPEQKDIVPVKKLIELFSKHWGHGAKYEFSNASKNLKEANFLSLDTGLIKSEFGWEPIVSLDKGLQMTAEWYKLYILEKSKNQILKLMKDQILSVTEKT